MFSRRILLASGLSLAILAAGCNATGSSASPEASPTAVPTVTPTAVPATDSPTLAPSASSEKVLSFDEISVEGLAKTLIDGGWFGGRQDKTLDSGAKQILLSAQKSDVVLSIVHDGAGTLQRVTVYDPNLFGADPSVFDLGIIGGILLNQTLGLAFVNWEADLAAAKTAHESLLETKTFGPNAVTLRFGADADYPGDAFVYFEPAS